MKLSKNKAFCFNFLTIALAILACSCLQAEYGSVNIERVIRFHPYNLFLRIPELSLYISPQIISKRRGGYDPDNLYLIQNKLKDRLINENTTKLQKKVELRSKRMFLQERLDFLFYQYTQSAGAQKGDSESDKRYMQEKKGIEKEISGLLSKEKKLDQELSKLYLATPEEERKIRKTILSDIRSAVAEVRDKKRLSGIVYVKSTDLRPELEERIEMKQACALDKRGFTSQDKEALRYYMRRSRETVPWFANGWNELFLYGGRDVTLDVLDYLFEKYRFSGDMEHYIYSYLEGSQQ